MVPYENIRKTATGQGHDYATGCLLDYAYFRDNYKMTAIYLRKQEALDADPRAIQQITLLQIQKNTRIFYIYEEAKDTALDFSQETVKVL